MDTTTSWGDFIQTTATSLLGVAGQVYVAKNKTLPASVSPTGQTYYDGQAARPAVVGGVANGSSNTTFLLLGVAVMALFLLKD